MAARAGTNPAPTLASNIQMRSRPLLCAVLTALLAASFFISVHFVIIPLQRAGALDITAAFLVAMGSMLNLPGLVAGRLIFITEHHVVQADLPAFFFLSSAVSAIFWGISAGLLMRWRRAHPPAPPAPGRRRFLGRAGLAVLGGGACLGAYSVLVEPRRLLVRRLDLPLRGLPRGLEGLKVVHLTDLHLGWYTPASFLEQVVEQANALEPDLVLLTGDYVHGAPEFVAQVCALLGRLRGRAGVVGVMGNHDHWVGADVSRAGLRGAGIRLLENGHIWLGVGGLSGARPAGGGLCLAGLEDPWEGRPDLEVALRGVPGDDPRLVLCHNPDFAESASARASGGVSRVDLMLCGHTHGGQVRLPLLGTPIVPSRYGDRYARGMVKGPAFPVHVSAGVGTTILPVRLGVPPEMTLFTLKRA